MSKPDDLASAVDADAAKWLESQKGEGVIDVVTRDKDGTVIERWRFYGVKFVPSKSVEHEAEGREETTLGEFVKAQVKL